MPTKYSVIGDKLFAQDVSSDGANRNLRLVAVVPKSLVIDDIEFGRMLASANGERGKREQEKVIYGIENADTHSPSIVNIVFS